MSAKIIRVLKAIILAPLALLAFFWMGFLCIGGFVMFLEVPQPYQALLWAAMAITMCIPIGCIIYEGMK